MPASPPTVPRRAILDDMAAVSRIHRLAFSGAMPGAPVLHTPEEDWEFYAKVVFARDEIWLTEQSGLVTGFIAFRPGCVDHFHVHPDHQGRGLGRVLLGLAQASTDSIRLWTFQSNHGARRFYEKHGFNMERETDGAGNEEQLPDILYHWKRATRADGLPT